MNVSHELANLYNKYITLSNMADDAASNVEYLMPFVVKAEIHFLLVEHLDAALLGDDGFDGLVYDALTSHDEIENHMESIYLDCLIDYTKYFPQSLNRSLEVLRHKNTCLYDRLLWW